MEEASNRIHVAPDIAVKPEWDGETSCYMSSQPLFYFCWNSNGSICDSSLGKTNYGFNTQIIPKYLLRSQQAAFPTFYTFIQASSEMCFQTNITNSSDCRQVVIYYTMLYLPKPVPTLWHFRLEFIGVFFFFFCLTTSSWSCKTIGWLYILLPQTMRKSC